MTQPRPIVRFLRLLGFALATLLVFAIAGLLYVSKQQAHNLITNPANIRSRATSTPARYWSGVTFNSHGSQPQGDCMSRG